MIDTQQQLPLITYIPMPEKLPDKIDLTRCMAFKSKTDKQQCPCRHRPGSRFCGKHAQTKQEILANGTRRSANRTLLASSIHTQLHNQPTKPKLQIKNLAIKPEILNQSNTHKKQIKLSNIQNQTQITQLALQKDPYLSKLTSQQINENFLFYKLNKYLSPANNTVKQTTQTNLTDHELTTEHKRKLLIRLLTLLTRIDRLDPSYKKIIRLQRAIRKNKYRIRQWNRGKGAIYPLIQCTNNDDFCSLDTLDTIPPRLLFTYRDNNGFTYGFNLLSFLELLSGNEQPLNPYTRKPIDRNVINRANKYYRILYNWSKIDELSILAHQQQPEHDSILNISNGSIIQSTARLSFKDRIKQRLQNVFQKINYLGYQTNTDWLLDKPAPILISFIKTLARNWSYQLGFTETTKQVLLAPAEKLVFETLVNDAYRNPQLGHASTLHIMNRILAVLEPLINNPADPNSAALLVLYSIYYIDPRRVSLANPWMN